MIKLDRIVNEKTFAKPEVVVEFTEKWKDYNPILKKENGEVVDLVGSNRDWRDQILYVSLKSVGSIYIRQMPGLCGIAVIYFSNQLFTDPKAYELVEEILLYMGYTVLMVSEITGKKQFMRDEWSVIINNFDTFGFQPYFELNNRRTGNNVTLYYKHLLWK